MTKILSKRNIPKYWLGKLINKRPRKALSYKSPKESQQKLNVSNLKLVGSTIQLHIYPTHLLKRSMGGMVKDSQYK
jgi:hypothetical protein